MKKALPITIGLVGVVIVGLLLFVFSRTFTMGDYKGEAKETLYFPASEIWNVVVDNEGVEVLESDDNGPLKWEKDGGIFERWRYDFERGYVVKMISSTSGTTGLWTYELVPYDASKTMVKVAVDVDVEGLFGSDYLTAEEELARIVSHLE